MRQNRTHLFYSPALRYFVAVAEIGSIRAAARDLNVASSAVNRQILNLEQDLGLQLFDRVGRRLRISEAGEILMRHAKRTFADFETAVATIDDLSGLKRGSVKIATVESVADAVLPKLLSSFQTAYPGIQVEVEIGSSAEVFECLMASECHLAITFNPPDQAVVADIGSYNMEIGAVVAPDHPLAGRPAVSFKECLKYPLAIPQKGLSVGKIIDDLLEAMPAPVEGEFESVIKTNSLRLTRSLLYQKHYVAFQTRLGLDSDRKNPDLVFLPITEPALPTDRLVILKSTTQALALAPSEFARYAKDMLKIVANSA